MISGAASCSRIQLHSLVMALFQVSEAPIALHFKMCSVVSCGCWQPGHSADLACFLMYRE